MFIRQRKHFHWCSGQRRLTTKRTGTRQFVREQLAWTNTSYLFAWTWNEPLDVRIYKYLYTCCVELRPYLRFNFTFMCVTDINRVGRTKRAPTEIKYQKKRWKNLQRRENPRACDMKHIHIFPYVSDTFFRTNYLITIVINHIYLNKYRLKIKTFKLLIAHSYYFMVIYIDNDIE